MITDKIYRSGTHRSATPFETLARIQKFLPVFGITRVANIAGLDRIGIPVVTAIRPNSKSLATSQGKGVTIEAAKVSAIMESIESFHAENIFRELLYVSHEELSFRNNLVDISGVARSYHHPFDYSEKMLWMKGHDLMNDQEVWVPHDLVSTDFSVAHRQNYLISDSNGLSSGNIEVESMIHGICEVIERDALALFFNNPLAYISRKIIPESIQSPENRALLELIEKANVEFGIWDITSDIGIPTFICKTIDHGEYFESMARPAYGSGTHLDKNIALSRAITEAVQSRATFISGSRDDQPLGHYLHSNSASFFEDWKGHIASANTWHMNGIKSIENESFEKDMDYLLTALSHVGINQVISVDLTKPEVGIPVSKIIIPHLEGITHTHDRVAGSRLNRGIHAVRN